MRFKHLLHLGVVCGLAAAMGLLSGCAVPQPRGQGTRFFLKEPQTNRPYWLYLPVGYSPAEAWPMVLSLHGMKPFDHAESQELEWEQLADRYQLIVLAPDLNNSDLFMQYPLRNITSSVQKDERAVLLIMAEVMKRCNVDKSKIFGTSWSSGGYLLHYIANNNPDLFAAISARGSCFSLDAVQRIPRSKVRHLADRKMPVMVYYGSNDLSGVREESKQAVQWYQRLRIPVTREVVTGGGHERVPDLAARFFKKHGAEAQLVQAVDIEASYKKGVAPFWIHLKAKLPGVERRDYRKYRFTWYLDGKVQGNESTLFMTIYRAGEHVVQLEVFTPDQQKFESHTKVVVLPRPSALAQR